jgi:hypothetical protein
MHAATSSGVGASNFIAILLPRRGAIVRSPRGECYVAAPCLDACSKGSASSTSRAVVAGPFATAILADLGADVVKLERPRTGDDYRYGPSPKGDTSLSFQNTNRGKRSITLDLRAADARCSCGWWSAPTQSSRTSGRAGWRTRGWRRR